MIKPFTQWSFLIFLLALTCMLLMQCQFTQKVNDGTTAYELMQYDRAIPMLKKEYERAKLRTQQGRIAFMIGESYTLTSRPEEAAEWYRRAYDYQYGPKALQQYAQTQKQLGEYKLAMQAFRDLGIEIGSPYEYRKEIAGCQRALQWQSNPDPAFEVKPAGINSPAYDYAPVSYSDHAILFSSDRSTANGGQVYHWTGRSFSDLFLANLQDGSVTPFSTSINTPDNEGTASIVGSLMVFTRCTHNNKYEDAYCQLYQSHHTAEGWSMPVRLTFQDAAINYGHPALSEDGKWMVFSSEQADGWGDRDLYITQYLGEADWSTPTLLSRSINTDKDEVFPVFDGDTLYFSSNGHVGMGGLDIFSSYQVNGNWTPAYNLQPPINSPADDMSYSVNRSQDLAPEVLQQGYFSSNRYGGMGMDDIYLFQKKILPEPIPNEEPVDATILLHVYVLENIYADPNDPNSRILGRKPLDAAEILILSEGTDQEFRVGADGLYAFEPQLQQDYEFVAGKSGYLTRSATFSTVGIVPDPKHPSHIFEIEIVLDRIFYDREIVLNNIYYDFDESYIRTDAQPTLNALAQVLKQNPSIHIQMGSHTDCRGADAYNQTLSQARAQAAVTYLIEQGISESRLSAVGYGESKPATDCSCTRCSEVEHQLNRRTTFTILKE